MSFKLGRTYQSRSVLSAIPLHTKIGAIDGGAGVQLISRDGGPGTALVLALTVAADIWEIRPGDYRAFTFVPADVETADSPTANFNSIVIDTPVANAYQAGDGPLQLTDGGGGLPGGLLAATDYWVRPVAGTDRIRFYTTEALALAGVAGTEEDLTSGGGAGPHTIGGMSLADDFTGFYNSIDLTNATLQPTNVSGLAGAIIEAPDRLTVQRTSGTGNLKFWFMPPQES